MKNRIDQTLSAILRNQGKVLCTYVTLGYPNLQTTRQAILAMQDAGSDILELGIPFSDPLADGPTIQRASELAIRNQVGLRDGLSLVKTLRKSGQLKMPVILFSYLNPILNFGMTRLVAALSASGFDGVIVPDLPPEEGMEFERMLAKKKLSLIYLAAPTSTRERMEMIGRRSKGFIYYVSLRGVTGARAKLPADLNDHVRQLKKISKKPVLVGFGVSGADQAKRICKTADGVIVGSAVVNLLKNGVRGVPLVKRLVHSMAKVVHSK